MKGIIKKASITLISLITLSSGIHASDLGCVSGALKSSTAAPQAILSDVVVPAVVVPEVVAPAAVQSDVVAPQATNWRTTFSNYMNPRLESARNYMSSRLSSVQATATSKWNSTHEYIAQNGSKVMGYAQENKAKTAAIVAGTGLAMYGIYKAYRYFKPTRVTAATQKPQAFDFGSDSDASVYVAPAVAEAKVDVPAELKTIRKPTSHRANRKDKNHVYPVLSPIAKENSAKVEAMMQELHVAIAKAKLAAYAAKQAEEAARANQDEQQTLILCRQARIADEAAQKAIIQAQQLQAAIELAAQLDMQEAQDVKAKRDIQSAQDAQAAAKLAAAFEAEAQQAKLARAAQSAQDEQYARQLQAQMQGQAVANQRMQEDAQFAAQLAAEFEAEAAQARLARAAQSAQDEQYARQVQAQIQGQAVANQRMQEDAQFAAQLAAEFEAETAQARLARAAQSAQDEQYARQMQAQDLENQRAQAFRVNAPGGLVVEGNLDAVMAEDEEMAAELEAQYAMERAQREAQEAQDAAIAAAM